MISFELSEDQIHIQHAMHTLAREKLRPRSLEIDSHSADRINQAYLEIIGENGLNALFISTAYGGKQLNWISLALVMEELGYGDPGFAGIYAQTLHAVSTLLIGGSHEQKAAFLPQLLLPEGVVASFCATEKKSGSDTSSFDTTARLNGDYFILNGCKHPVINAGSSIFYVVWANTSADKGRAGINAFVIPQDTPGITFSPYHDKLGIRSTPTATVFLEDVAVPRNNLIGLSGSGYLLLMQTIDWGRAFVGAIAVGLVRAILEEAVNFAKKRVILNRPIIRNQAISFTLADLTTELEAARFLVWKACRCMDLERDFAAASAMAKLYASELAVRAANEGMLIQGHQGFIGQSLMQKYQRDAQALRIVEGTSHIQKIIIANQL